MRIPGVLLIALLLLGFQDTTKNVVKPAQEPSTSVVEIDTSDFRKDTAYAGRLYREAKVLMYSAQYDLALEKLDSAEKTLIAIVRTLDTVIRPELFRIKEKKIAVSQILGIDTKLCQELIDESYNAFGLNEFERAFELMDSAIKVQSINIGYYDSLTAHALYSKSDLLIRFNRAKDAVISAEKAIDISDFLYGPFNQNHAISLEIIGIASYYNGDIRNAIEKIEEAYTIKRKVFKPKDKSLAVSLNNLGQFYSILNDNENALRALTESSNILKEVYGEDHWANAVASANLGSYWGALGQYEKELQYLSQARAIIKKHPSRPLLIQDILLALSNSYMSKKDFVSAKTCHEEMKQLVKTSFDINHPRYARMLVSDGLFEHELKNYSEAIEKYFDALKIYDDIGENVNEKLECLQFISNAQSGLKDYEASLESLNEKLDEMKNFYPGHHVEISSTICNIARLYYKMGNYNVALSLFNNVRQSVTLDEDNYPETSIRLLNFCLSGMREVLLDSMKVVNRDVKKIMLDSIISLNNQILRLDELAMKVYTSNKLRLLNFPEVKTNYEIAIENRLIRLDRNDVNAGFIASEKLKNRELTKRIKLESYRISFGIPDSLREKEYDLGIDLAYYEKEAYIEEFEIAETSDSILDVLNEKLFKLNREQDELQELVKFQYPKYYNARYSQKVISVSGVKDTLLKDNQALLEYFVGDSSIFTFTILPDTFYVHQIKKDFPLDQWVEDMLHGIYDPYTNTTDSARQYSYTHAAQKIYRKVFYHVDTLLPESTDIILVPDGILGYIPFDALITDSTNSSSYLIRDHQISYAYSATLQAEMENMQHDEKSRNKVLAFAPSFNQSEVIGDTVLLASRSIDVSDERNWLSPLKYNDDEVMAISQLTETDLFLDSTATKDQFIKNAGDYSVIHLSTHGKANDKMGDYSFLAFYDPQDSSETWLYNRELYGLNLNADMVVLSACETGIGELQRGEGIISLARGFSYAGAKSIVTTLWSVNDRSTQKVMELFYANLKEGMRKDEALRQAKLSYLDHHSNLGSAPYFWAGIIPIGDMSPVKFHTIWYQNPWIWLGTTFLLVLGIWASRKFF